MSLTKEDLVFDLYYASSTDEEGNKLAQLTVQFRDASAVPHKITQLARTTLKRDRSKVCAVGEQSVKKMVRTLCWPPLKPIIEQTRRPFSKT
ncbi:hypothetical protein [Klebsiella pneumoniae]|uniref:hypothetical protein n=1 Tax=Klebsiella pneumoniae TaxID=573 RepID=UPI002949EA41|nr:hypothetical protein [Klebsiella pneumoniae]MDV5722822.1 hypothetical protein [Klebsiella pneumoniae]